MPQFDISTLASQVFWVLVVFLIQYLIALFVIIPTFRKLFSSRKSYIAKQIREAEELMARAEELKRSYEEKIASAKKFNADSIDLAMQEIKDIADKRVAELDKQFSKELHAYEKEVTDFYKSMSDDFEKLTLDTAEEIIRKVTNRAVNKKKLEKYIN
jgi:F-type H+-transporting ATPase subunit b